MDSVGWTASGLAAVEAVVITGVVVRRRRSERGRMIRVAVEFGYRGPDTVDDEIRGDDAGGSSEAVTPPE